MIYVVLRAYVATLPGALTWLYLVCAVVGCFQWWATEHDGLKKAKLKRPKKNPGYGQWISARQRFWKTMKTLFRTPKTRSPKTSLARRVPTMAYHSVFLVYCAQGR